jgi:carboxymethylenebutenolidase
MANRTAKPAVKVVLTALLLVALSPGAHGAVVDPRDQDLVSETIAYKSGAVDIAAYLSRPKKDGKHPAVIVIHGNSGTSPYNQDVARRLAKAGYVAIAPDLLSPAGGTGKFGDQEAQRAALRAISREDIHRDLDYAFEYLEKHPYVRPDRIGVVGFCWGGGYAFMMATRLPRLRAAAVFYGRNPDPIDLVKNIRADLLVVHGEEDVNFTRHVPELEKALKQHGKPYDLKIYSGAGHAFHNDTSERSYRPEAARAAWERAMSFFQRTLQR